MVSGCNSGVEHIVSGTTNSFGHDKILKRRASNWLKISVVWITYVMLLYFMEGNKLQRKTLEEIFDLIKLNN